MHETHCTDHRKKLLHFLTVKTAPVRCGVKPGALLRVPLCAHVQDAGACVRRYEACAELDDVLRTLNLAHRVLRDTGMGCLVLFYDREKLAHTLAASAVSEFLDGHGYDSGAPVEAYLDVLKARFDAVYMPHEIGIFLGYPLKDVAGFIAEKDAAHAIRGDWKIFGAPDESLRVMHLYRRAETLARRILGAYRNFEFCLEKIANLKLNTPIMENAHG